MDRGFPEWWLLVVVIGSIVLPTANSCSNRKESEKRQSEITVIDEAFQRTLNDFPNAVRTDTIDTRRPIFTAEIMDNVEEYDTVLFKGVVYDIYRGDEGRFQIETSSVFDYGSEVYLYTDTIPEIKRSTFYIIVANILETKHVKDDGIYVIGDFIAAYPID